MGWLTQLIKTLDTLTTILGTFDSDIDVAQAKADKFLATLQQIISLSDSLEQPAIDDLASSLKKSGDALKSAVTNVPPLNPQRKP